MALALGGHARLEQPAQQILRDGRAVIGDHKGKAAQILRNGQPDVASRLILHGVHGVVHEVADDAAELPRRHGQALQRAADVHLQRDAAFLARRALDLQQRVESRHLGAQNRGNGPVLVVYALQIGGGLAVFLHLQQAVNHLQVVEKVVPLGAQLQVERVHLFIGRLQFADGALQPAGAQGILNVHARAPGGHQRARDDHELQRPAVARLRPRGEHIEHEGKQHADLHGVDHDGQHRGFLNVGLAFQLMLHDLLQICVHAGRGAWLHAPGRWAGNTRYAHSPAACRPA